MSEARMLRVVTRGQWSEAVRATCSLCQWHNGSECRKHAPVYERDDVMRTARWPRTTMVDYCGDFIERKEDNWP